MPRRFQERELGERFGTRGARLFHRRQGLYLSRVQQLGRVRRFKRHARRRHLDLDERQKMDDSMGKGRFTMKFTSPASYTFTYEMSPDGAKWTTAVDGKATKK